jgi:hypothetical protein
MTRGMTPGLTPGLTRGEIEALLPFMANGTLTGEERQMVEAAVNADLSLQDELATLRAIRLTMQAETVQSPGDFGVARLMRETQPHATPSRPLLWQIAAGVLLAIVVGQGALMIRDPVSDGYELAGQVSPALIGFAPEATDIAKRELLLEAGVEIIGGPSALGLYEFTPIQGVTFEQASAILEASDLVETLEPPSE